MKASQTLHAAMLCGLVVFFLQVQAKDKKNRHFPDDILSAKTIVIRVNLVGGTVYEKRTKHWGPAPHHYASADELKPYIEQAHSEVEEVFTRKKRFQVVSDPAAADLVCLVIIYSPNLGEGKISGEFSHAIMVLKGGTSAHWDAVPLWMTTSIDLAHKWYTDDVALLHDHIQKAEKNNP
ncbi:MAG TPA: hypothetical protein VIB39_20435 [Candidatus Angelobacter sp.]|jgi:hypothetical protein